MRRLLRAAGLAALLLYGLASPAAANDPLVYAVQEVLAGEGYDTGRADGVLGPRTKAAISAYEEDYGMPVTGMISPGLVTGMGLAAYASELATGPGFRASAAPAAGGSGNDTSRKLAPLRLIPPVVSMNASIDTETPSDLPSQKAAVENPVAVSSIPPVSARFSPRNWLVRDLGGEHLPAAAPFGVFLEDGGKVAGPRFAGRLRWQADGAHFVMTYRNSVGQEIRRTGKLNGLNRIEGEAVGPDGKTWRWMAEAEPL